MARVRGNLERAGDLGGAASVDDAVAADEVAHDADGVVQRALRLVDDHLVAAAHVDRHRLRVGAVLDDDHPVLGRAEGLLVHVAWGRGRVRVRGRGRGRGRVRVRVSFCGFG